VSSPDALAETVLIPERPFGRLTAAIARLVEAPR
jgi:hypothetical protein